MKIFSGVVCILVLGCVPVYAQAGAQQKPAAAAAPAQQQPSRVTVVVPNTGAAGTIDPAEEADIRQLMEVSGAKNLVMQSVREMERTLRPLMTKALPPGAYRDKLIELFFEKFHQKLDPQVFVDMAVPIYAKYYTDDEIKGLIQFDQTPLGRKVLTTLPKLQMEIQKSARDWGQNMGRECMTEVLAEHPELRKALEEAAQAEREKP